MAHPPNNNYVGLNDEEMYATGYAADSSHDRDPTLDTGNLADMSYVTSMQENFGDFLNMLLTDVPEDGTQTATVPEASDLVLPQTLQQNSIQTQNSLRLGQGQLPSPPPFVPLYVKSPAVTNHIRAFQMQMDHIPQVPAGAVQESSSLPCPGPPHEVDDGLGQDVVPDYPMLQPSTQNGFVYGPPQAPTVHASSMQASPIVPSTLPNYSTPPDLVSTVDASSFNLWLFNSPDRIFFNPSDISDVFSSSLAIPENWGQVGMPMSTNHAETFLTTPSDQWFDRQSMGNAPYRGHQGQRLSASEVESDGIGRIVGSAPIKEELMFIGANTLNNQTAVNNSSTAVASGNPYMHRTEGSRPANYAPNGPQPRYDHLWTGNSVVSAAVEASRSWLMAQDSYNFERFNPVPDTKGKRKAVDTNVAEHTKTVAPHLTLLGPQPQKLAKSDRNPMAAAAAADIASSCLTTVDHQSSFTAFVSAAASGAASGASAKKRKRLVTGLNPSPARSLMPNLGLADVAASSAGQENITCAQCQSNPAMTSKTHPTQESLNEHINHAHRRHSCPFAFAGCTVDFASVTELRRHVKTIHLKEESRTCPLCPNMDAFARADNFREHWLTMHTPADVKNAREQLAEKTKQDKKMKKELGPGSAPGPAPGPDAATTASSLPSSSTLPGSSSMDKQIQDHEEKLAKVVKDAVIIKDVLPKLIQCREEGCDRKFKTTTQTTQNGKQSERTAWSAWVSHYIISHARQQPAASETAGGTGLSPPSPLLPPQATFENDDGTSVSFVKWAVENDILEEVTGGTGCTGGTGGSRWQLTVSASGSSRCRGKQRRQQNGQPSGQPSGQEDVLRGNPNAEETRAEDDDVIGDDNGGSEDGHYEPDPDAGQYNNNDTYTGDHRDYFG